MHRLSTSRSVTALALPAFAILAGCGGHSGGSSGDGFTEKPAPATWAKSYGGPGDDQANAVAATADGGFIVAGSWDVDRAATGVSPTDGDAWLMKLDALGNVEWQRQFGAPDITGSEGERIGYVTVREAPDGTHWAVGSRYGGAADDIAALHIDASGTPIEAPYTYDSGAFPGYDYFFESGTSADVGHDVWPTADGGALLIGRTSADLRTNDASGMLFTGVVPYVVKIAADGTRIWSRHIARAGDDRTGPQRDLHNLLIREASDGGAVATFIAYPQDGGSVQRIARIDAAGTILWTRDLDISVRDFLASSVDGDIVLVGFADGGGRIMRVAAADGATVWRRELGGIWERGALDAVAEHCTPPATAASCVLYAGGHVYQPDPGAAMVAVTTEGDVAASSMVVDGAEYVAALRDRPGDTAGAVDVVGTFRRGLPFASFTTAVDAALVPFDTVEIPGLRVPKWAASLTSTGDVLMSDVELEGYTHSFIRLNPPGEFVWSLDVDPFGVPSADRALSVYPTADGGYIVGGDSTSFGDGSHSVWLVRFDGAGDINWQRALDGFQPNSDSAHVYPTRLLLQAKDGNLLVVGHTPEGVRAMQLDAGGLERWNSLPLTDLDTMDPYDFTGHMVGTVDIAADDAEGYIVAGNSTGASWIAWLDGSGSVVRYREVTGVLLSDVVARPDGYVLAGTKDGEPWASALDDDDQAAWSRTYPPGISDASQTVRIEPHPDGGYVMTANVIDASPASSEDEAAEFGRRNIIVYRLEEDGALRWSRLYGGLFDEFAYGLDVLDDGGIVIAGRSDSVGDLGEAWVLRLGPDGRIADGCLAMLSDASAVARNAEAPAISMRVPEFDGAALSPALVVPLETTAPARSEADVVIARQCLGTAQTGAPSDPRPKFKLTVAQGGGIPGVVTSTPQGIVCGTVDGGVCSADFDRNMTVFLDVDFGSYDEFARWEGCDEVDDTLCSVRMNADREVTVFFEEEPDFELAFEISGNGRVQFDVPEQVCPAGEPCNITYANGETAVVTALPADGEDLVGWGGDCAEFDRAPTFELLMDADMHCTATFSGEPGPVQSLNISRFANGIEIFDSTVVGSVASVPAGIDCPEQCSAQFPRDAAVTVVPTPAAGWEFERFVCPDAGDEDYNQLTATIVMSEDKSCVAHFRDDIVRIGVTFSEPDVGRVYSNTGGLDCTRDCSWPFFYKTNGTITPLTIELHVELTNNTRYFDHWEGCGTVVPDPPGLPVCLVSNQRSTSVHAAFLMVGGNSYTLSIQKADTAGRGSVTTSPGGIDCGSICAHTFAAGMTVTLVATPEPGSTFSQWRGDLDCVDGVVVMSASRVCEAVFLRSTATFSVTISSITGPGRVQDTSGGGLDCPGTCTATFMEGEQVAVFGDITQPGASFDGWGGDCASFGTQSGMLLTMDRDYVCTAAFSP